MKKENGFKKELEEHLSDSENIKLFKEMKNNKDNRALIILRNLNLVKAVVENYGTNYDKYELFQIGVLELIDCVDKFDCEKRKSFIKYATINIERRIIKALNNLPNNEMIVNYGHITSIDDNDMIDNEYITDFETNIEENYEKKELATRVRDYVNSLPQISRESIKMYYGFYGKQYTFKEISLTLNVPRSSIRRIITKELMIIRSLISTRRIDKVIKTKRKRK